MSLNSEFKRLIDFLNKDFPEHLLPGCNTIDIVITVMKETKRLSAASKELLERVEPAINDQQRMNVLQDIWEESIFEKLIPYFTKEKLDLREAIDGHEQARKDAYIASLDAKDDKPNES